MQKYKTEDLSKVEPGHGVPVRYAVVYLASEVDARIAELQQHIAKQESQDFDLSKRVAELEQALREAIEDIDSWAGYASEYFQEKHDLAGGLAKHRATLGKSGSQT